MTQSVKATNQTDESVIKPETNSGKTFSPPLSIITPLFNEEANIRELANRLSASMQSTGLVWEWIAVDDGSSDQTFELVREFIKTAPSFQLIKLSRNFGQQAAYRAGLEVCRGQAIVFMDADMQDPPEMIPDMIACWRNGAKQVVGRRQSRPERGIRGFFMRAFHMVFHTITGGIMPNDSGTFALIDRLLADELKSMPERSLFLPAQRSWLGFPTSEVWYDRSSRKDEPKQSLIKLFKYAWDGITSFSTLPLHLISATGTILCVFGFGYAGILVGIRLLQSFGYFQTLAVPGFTTLSVAVFCLGGIQLLSLGVVGSYISKIFAEVKQRPMFIVSDRITSEV